MYPTILCEKPKQALTYGQCYDYVKHKDYIEIKPCSTFPKGAKIVWAIGHLAELAPPEKYKEEWKTWTLDTLPMIPDNFQYVISKDKASHFKSVKKHLQDSDEIIISTDPGREGEAIARTLILLSGCSKKPLKRFWCSSMTPNAVRKAFDNLKDARDYTSLFQEAQARAYSDWLIGMNTSRAYTLLMQKKGVKEVFSTGRCQTPLLCLIHQREEEINNFKPERYWEIQGSFSAHEQKYNGKLQNDNQNRFKDKNKAQELVNQLKQGHPYISKVETKTQKNRPPKLHNLSSLQAKINRKYKISPSDVLRTVQSLYDQSLCSYPRTEYQFLPIDEARQLPEILENLSTLEPYKKLIMSKNHEQITDDKHFVDDSKVGDHYALIVTEKVPDLSKLSKEEQLVYDEIARSVIAAHYNDHVYNQTTLITKIEEHEFKSTGKQILDNGWKVVWQDDHNQDDKEDNQQLPKVEENQNVSLIDLLLKEGITKAPKPYSEGQLITLMKTAGRVGQDSEELDSKDLNKYGSLGTEATRSGIIEGLKARKYIIVKKNIVETTFKGKMLVKAVSNTILSSAELTAKWEMYLQKIGEGEKPAKAFIDSSKKLSQKLVEQAIKSSYEWKFDDMVQQIQQEGQIGKCPSCGKAVLARKKFYGCSGYKEGCKFIFSNEYLGKKISETNAKKLLEKGKTGLIKGLKGKNSTFDAYIIFRDKKQGSLTLEFPARKKTTSR
ncbi:type IA DNA topoisomerase [Priestia endophytica]|uniref:DNA topoisomerase n=1 Tax=Priestia endophytica DSM 13796 TaxID=1121089 RepID=A0A1I6C020_9BACI|nr:type IA DNA topoisomerase [Priestia endophytica]KYG33464.1 hypothetical protein AZF06_21710 [Priestia endophytica]SFQ86523.1 DNA topoisomerase-3 [Priestia endophytica DSM 13796]